MSIELAIKLSSSVSVRSTGFEEGKAFLQEFIEQLEIGPQRTRVSLLTFGDGVYVRDGFNLTTYATKDQMIEAIKRVPFRSGRLTATGKAIDYMRSKQLDETKVRPGVQKVCIVITDGNSQEGNKTKEAAKKARSDNIIMYAVAVGEYINDPELASITGNVKDRVAKVSNYTQLKTIQEKLVNMICRQVRVSCGERSATDVLFVFDPRALVNHLTTRAIRFVSQTQREQLGFEYYGVFSCPEDVR
ncbi:collagen alpha-1(xiv) chain-like [Plakobranchus ocellatus]|uniref:Collagen alpha-1(Xiv) chain-like n=1 Tax=Plakobranchus ocellatus TaxID=259542 RepID=A0AAV4DSS1_9GAST|nr:collagen alpha-1(xiv) chain-like [Plakobranchus ocellatus]